VTIDTSQDYGVAVCAAREFGSQIELRVGDMVFVFPPGTSMEQAERVWREARRQHIAWWVEQAN